MNNSYIRTPESISIKSIEEKGFTLSSSQYMDLIMPNKNYKLVGDFLSRPLKRSDLGVEVGSINYISQSPFYFLRTKALQSYSFLPEITSESALPVMPSVFVKQNLKEGDLLISKDSNIGEIVILDKDYPNFMTSSAIYKLPVNEHKFYLLAFIKHQIFREQIDFMVPKGATIRHAKTMFLDCKIPIPNKNREETMKFVEVLTQAIINKEKSIIQKLEETFIKIEQELNNNQKINKFKLEYPTISELEKVGRLDTGMYSEHYKKIKHLIENYKNGYCSFLQLNNGNVDISRGQNLQESNIGKSIYSESFMKGFYKLCLSKNFTNSQTLIDYLYIGNIKELKKIKKGELIFSCRGDMGRNMVFVEEIANTITNIDNVHIKFDNQELFKTIFIGQFLNWLKHKNYISKIAISGSGADSFTIYQFDLLDIPNFTVEKQMELSKIYYNGSVNYNSNNWSLNNFLTNDNEFNKLAGIYELDKTAKQLKAKLNSAIDNIVNDKPVKIEFL